MHRGSENSRTQNRYESQHATGQHHRYKSGQDQVNTDDRSDGCEEIDIARAHCSEYVQEEHQDKSQYASGDAVETTTESSLHEVNRESADQGGKYDWIGNAAIAHVVVNDQHGERN